ncbi:hypothetical protein [Thiohalomonas denitrificans]|uniref:hypothetical protein n=1 Tax=Thiohalomonas denitrificans TaxID=415747 RepID=UPI0026EA7930|nr:hypothetical protein [Thiohalomonas denitrificans]
MMTPAGIVDAQLHSLLELIEQHRDERCRAISEQAEERRRELLTEAHRQARQQMHRAIQSERRRARSELTAARARLQTRTRQQQYRIALGLLHEGWDGLQEIVRERWSTAESRRLWIRALVAEAMVVLPQSKWRIEHPVGWDRSEMEQETARITGYCESPPEWVARDDIDAGLRFSTDGACLDGSAAGLLTERTALEARLLAEVNSLLGEDILSGPPEREL